MHLDEDQRWVEAYNTLCRKLQLNENSDGYMRSRSLWLRYLTGHIVLACSQTASQMSYDDYVQNFSEIVSIAKLLQSHPTGKSIFVFDPSYIPDLYFTAVRCRHPKVRREAIDVLLARPYREGVWDSLAAGNMAAAVMEIEEQGTNGSYIPEENRVRGTATKFNLPDRSGNLKCFLSTSEGLVVKERNIRW